LASDVDFRSESADAASALRNTNDDFVITPGLQAQLDMRQ
jgi:hypothetical protein